MSEPLVLLQQEPDGIATLTLNRPDKRNALNIDLMKAFCDKFEEAEQHPNNRLILVHGAGPAFCAGLDLAEASDKAKEEESAQLIARSLLKIYHSPLVTFAAVHGAAIAGGAGLMLAFDFVVAGAGTRIGFPEVRRGLVPAQISALLNRIVRWRDLRELLIAGELMEVDQALTLGLINKVVPLAELLPASLKWAHEILKGAPQAIRETKRLLRELEGMSLEQDLLRMMPYHHTARHSLEAKEGAQAFLEKREPIW